MLAVLDVPGTVGVEERLERVWELDLSRVRQKLMLPDPEGQGWSREQAEEAELWYRRFLCVILKDSNACYHVPNGPIDTFWHQHILDTAAYRQDCCHVLGYFLDHYYPYFGLNGDAEERDEAFVITNELYRAEFGEDCRAMRFHQVSNAAVTGSSCNSGGGTGCGQRGCGGGSR